MPGRFIGQQSFLSSWRNTLLPWPLRSASAAAAAATAAATAAAVTAASVVAAATPNLPDCEHMVHTEQHAVRGSSGGSGGSSTQSAAAAAAAAAAAVADPFKLSPSSILEPQPSLQQLNAAAADNSTAAAAAVAAAAAAAARAAAAAAAVETAALQWQQALRLAAYSFQQGLVDCSLLVGWITKQLVTACSLTTEELRQGSLLLAAAALQRIASCHTTVVHLSNSLLQYLEDKAVPLPTTKQQQQQQQQQLSASNGINRSSSSSTRDVAAVLAEQLLHQLVLLAPASLVALDGLPALCRLLLGPAVAHSVLFSSSSSSFRRCQGRTCHKNCQILKKCFLWPVTLGLYFRSFRHSYKYNRSRQKMKYQ